MPAELKVAEGYGSDLGKGIIRMDTATRRELGVSSGDIVKVVGERETGAKVWQSYPQDEDRKVVRMDGIIRQNAGAGVGDKVRVEKLDDIKPTKSFALARTKRTKDIRFGGNWKDFIRKNLVGKPISEQDKVYITYLAQPLPFQAVEVKPKGITKVTADTEVKILKETIEELEERPSVTYEDIGGMKEQIRKVREMVELPLKHPELFKKIGIDPPKGVLLYGPPGTGKTLLAKAVANESDAYFTTIQGPEIVSKFVGEAEGKLRQIFKDAKKNAPAIIFIDEIDAIAPKRDEVVGEVEKRIVAQLLSLMDGMESRGDVIVIGATNRVNSIDPALRRAGRFDREVELGIPSEDERKEILQIHITGMPLGEKVDIGKLANRTHGYVGADLEALAREAAMKTLRRISPKIDMEEEKLPMEILKDLKVTKEDFEEAYKEVQPSAMREVFVEKPNVRWEDIGGLEEVKENIKEAVEWPLKYAKQFDKLGIKPPKGIFIYGPPGTGKTLLAKAVARESESNFILVNGPELLSKWVGESEKGMREIFRKARQSAPCVIFFDEVDSLAPQRGRTTGSHVTESIVNQLLTEMDGLEELKEVIVIGATNRPDMVDPALLRPGRFDRLVKTQKPSKQTRKKILEVHTRKTPLSKEVNIDEIATKTQDYSGADLEALVREAAMNALRKNKEVEQVTKENFEEALKQVKPSLKDVSGEEYQKFEEGSQSVSYV